MRDTLKSAHRYLSQARRARSTLPPGAPVTDVVRYWPHWRAEQRRDGSPLRDAVPWMPYRVIEALDRWLAPSMSVFEFGSGGSTLFFARRVRRVVTVEHDAQWAALVQAELRARGLAECELHVVPPSGDAPGGADPSDPAHYAS